MIKTALALIGLLALAYVSIYEYAPGAAERLGLPAKVEAFPCDSTYWRVYKDKGSPYVACPDWDRFHNLWNSRQFRAAESLLVVLPEAEGRDAFRK